MFNHAEFKATLSTIATLLNDNNVVWCLGSSSSLYVQGVAVVPKDLDIIVDVGQFDTAYNLLQALRPGQREEGVFGSSRYYKVPLLAAAFPAEIAGFKLDTNTLDTQVWEGVTIRVHPLAIELEMYKQRPGKEHVVALIEETLQKTARNA